MAVIERSPSATRPDYFEALPTLSTVAQWMRASPSTVGRAVDRLGIKTVDWGPHRRLDIPGLMAVTAEMRRFTQEEIAGDLMDHVEATAPKHAVAVQADLAKHFDGLKRRDGDMEGLLADLREALPKKYAADAERIVRGYLSSTK